MSKKLIAAASLAGVLIFGAAPAWATEDGPREVGASIESGDSPREVGAAIEDGSGPRDVGAPIDNGQKPRPNPEDLITTEFPEAE